MARTLLSKTHSNLLGTFWFLLLAVGAVILLVACSAEEEEIPTPPRPTSTRSVIVPRNDNVEALNAAQAILDNLQFGLAPLLLEDETIIELHSSKKAQVARMHYPQQPVAPTEWLAVDSFVTAFAVRDALQDVSQVNRVALGHFYVPAPVGNHSETVEHIAAWITFMDGSRAIVDLTPLATNFAPRHAPEKMMVNQALIEETYAERRDGVDMNALQPMQILEEDGRMFYLLAKVEVTFDRYLFQLRLHPVQPADPMRAMNISPGNTVNVEIDRIEFEKLQGLLIDAGPDAFQEQPELLDRQGRRNEQLTALMDDNLHLLWHLITKFQHEPPDPSLPTPTPLPTSTPTPTPEPTPTATPQKLPLITS